ncbi:MAG: RadC family protein [Burkholderiaceae bacterium]
MSLKSLPPALRPREKLLRLGPRALADAELLAILLRTGHGGRDALGLSHALLEQAGGLGPSLPAGVQLEIAGREQEVFLVLFLDARHRLIAAEELFQGTLNQTSVYPREVVKRALGVNAGAVVLAHNHPSGCAEPSAADAQLTRVLTQALALVDIRVLDHFVVTRGSVTSLAERGLL